MSISPELKNLIARLEQELQEIEFSVRDGLEMIQPILNRFPNNVVSIQLFASLSNNRLYVEISKRRIQITVNRLSSVDTTVEEVLEAGEDLSMELGKAIEAKISVRKINSRLSTLL